MGSGARSGSGSLRHALALILITAAALAATGTTAETEAEEAAGDPAALAEIAVEMTPQVAARVEQIRALRFEQVPIPRVVSATYLSDFAKRERRRQHDDPELALASEEAMARMVGFLAEDEDLEAFEEPGDLAAAAWDPRRDRLYVVADAVAESPALVEFLLAHELTHALEDQALGLPNPAEAEGDRAIARSALVEGTATALMMEYADRHIDQFALGLATLGLGGGEADLPDFAVAQAQFVYAGGQQFVERLHRRGGDWELIDDAFARRPPVSTAQILDPGKYVRDERPLPVAIDAGPLRRQGWERVEAGTVGELVTRQIIAVAGPEGVEAATEGWRGDRFELWAGEAGPLECAHPCRAELALVLRWRWESPGDVRRFDRALRRYLERGLDGRPAEGASWSLEPGAAAIAADGLEITLALAPSPELARELAGA